MATPKVEEDEYVRCSFGCRIALFSRPITLAWSKKLYFLSSKIISGYILYNILNSILKADYYFSS